MEDEIQVMTPFEELTDKLLTRSIQSIDRFRQHLLESREMLTEKRAQLRSNEPPDEEKDRAFWFELTTEVKIMTHRWNAIHDLIEDATQTNVEIHASKFHRSSDPEELEN